jgi:hypothetical protein
MSIVDKDAWKLNMQGVCVCVCPSPPTHTHHKHERVEGGMKQN